MKKNYLTGKRILALLLTVLLSTGLMLGCGSNGDANTASSKSSSNAASSSTDTKDNTQDDSSSESTKQENGPVTLTDMMGKEVSLEAPATKIVALNPADCEILYALGAGDTLVGRGTYCDYPEEVSSVPDVESGQSLSTEQVIALNPELVIMSSMGHTEEQAQALKDAGVAVAESEATDIDGVYTAIDMIGKLVGKTDEADKLKKSMKDSFATIEEDAKKASDGEKSIYFEVSPLEYGLWTAGSGTFLDEIAAMLGLKNAFSDVSGWAEISEEQVLERNPDYIVTITMYDGEGDTPEQEIMDRSGWADITAVKNKAVFLADNNQTARPGPRLVDAAQSLYDFIYDDK